MHDREVGKRMLSFLSSRGGQGRREVGAGGDLRGGRREKRGRNIEKMELKEGEGRKIWKKGKKIKRGK